MRLFIYLLISIFISIINNLYASEKDLPPIDFCAKRTEPKQQWFDQTQEYLSREVCGAAHWFDSFFQDERGIEEEVDRFVRVINTLKFNKNKGFSWNIRANARIQLPKLKERINLIFTDKEDTPLETMEQRTQMDLPISQSEETNRNIVALRWNVLRNVISAFSLSAGMPLNSLNFSLRARYRYLYNFDKSLLGRFTETFFWQIRGGFGETSRFDVERLLTKQTLTRWSLVGTLSETIKGMDWGGEAMLLHNLSPKQAISLNFSTWGNTNSQKPVDNYRVGIRYRQNIYRPWLFIELEPEVSWPQAENKRVEAFFFRVEVFFGRKIK